MKGDGNAMGSICMCVCPDTYLKNYTADWGHIFSVGPIHGSVLLNDGPYLL